MRLAYLVLVQTLCLAACEKTIINRGYVVTLADFNGIVVGRDTCDDVFSKIGSPTLRSSVRGEKGEYTWYYAYKKSEKNGFLDPEIVEQKTMAVAFDSKGTVMGVKECTGGMEVSAVSEKTQTSGKMEGILGETFGGLGKYIKRYSKDK
jgi:outer membrane protein assembly factor BamE (lipoprotein component of BamABCDE complex)